MGRLELERFKCVSKKVIVLTPGLLLLLLIIVDHFFYSTTYKQTLDVSLNMLPLLLFIFITTLKKSQKDPMDVIIQASFYVYIYGVLYQTIYIIPFSSIISAIANATWLNDVKERIENIVRMYEYTGRIIGINLIPFRKFIDYDIFHRQVVGNLIMLFPLGFYLPLIYDKINSFKKVLLTAFVISLSIELTQLISTLVTPSSYFGRAFDIDDIILNTAGAIIGYFVYIYLILMFSKFKLFLRRNKA